MYTNGNFFKFSLVERLPNNSKSEFRITNILNRRIFSSHSDITPVITGRPKFRAKKNTSKNYIKCSNFAVIILGPE